MFGQYLLEFVANIDNFITGLGQVQTAFNGVSNGVKALNQQISTDLTNRIQAVQTRINELSRALRTGQLNPTAMTAVMEMTRRTQAEMTRLVGVLATAQTAFSALSANAQRYSTEGRSLNAIIQSTNSELVNLQARLNGLRDTNTLDAAHRDVLRLTDELRDLDRQLAANRAALAANPRGAARTALRADQTRILNERTVRMDELDRVSATTRDATLNASAQSALNNVRAEEIGLHQQLNNELKGTHEATEAIGKAAKSTWEVQQAGVRAYLQTLITAGAQLSQIGGQMQRIGTLAIAAGALFFALGVKIVNTGAAYQQSMDTARSVITNLNTGTAESIRLFTELEKTVLKLAATTKFTASEVAEGAKFLGQAGLSAQEVITSLPAVLNLSMAGFVDLGRSAEIAADFMNGFQLRGQELSRVVDVLTKSEVVANTTLLQLANAFSFATPVASALGQSIEDTATVLSLLSNSGIKASRAGTGLAQILSGLIRDTGKTAALMERYGSSFEKVNPQVVSIIDILKEFKAVNVSAADILEQFGERAGRAMLALMNAPISKINEISDAIDNSFGEGLRQATLRWQNLNGVLVEFTSRVESIQVALFKKIEGQLFAVVTALTHVLDSVLAVLNNPAFDQTAVTVIYVVTTFSALLVVVGTLTIALGTLYTFIGGAMTAWASLGLSAQASAASLNAAGAAAVRDTEALLALAAANGAAADAVRALNAQLAVQRANLAATQQRTAAQLGNIPNTLGEARQAGWAFVVGLIRQGAATLSIWATALAAVTTAVYGLVRAWKPIEGAADNVGSATKSVQVLAQVLKSATEQSESLNKSLKSKPGDASNPANSFGTQLELASGWGEVTNQIYLLEDAWRSLLNSFDQFTSSIGIGVIGVFSTIGKGIRYVADLIGAFFVSAVRLAVVTLDILVRTLNVVVDVYHALARGIIGVWAAWKKWDINAGKKAMDEYAESVEKAAKSLEKVNAANAKAKGLPSISSFIERNQANISHEERTVKQVSELLGLMKNEANGQLGEGQIARLKKLKEAHGDTYESIQKKLDAARTSLIAYQKAGEINTSAESEQNKITKRAFADEMKAQIENAQAVQKELREAQEAGVVSSSVDALGKVQAQLAADRKIREEEKRLSDDRTNWEKKAQEEFERITESRLSGLEKEEKKIATLKAKWTEYYEELNKQSQAHEANMQLALEGATKLEKEQLEGRAKYEAELKKRHETQLATAKPERKVDLTNELAHEFQVKMADYDRVTQNASERKMKAQTELRLLEEKKKTLAAQNAEVNSKLAEDIKKAQNAEIKARKDFLDDQRVREAKARGDSLTAARLDIERDYELEKEKIEKIFVIRDAGNLALKQQALKAAADVRTSRIAEAEKEAEEEAKRNAKKEQKERLKELKEAANPLLSVHEEAAKALAKQVKSLHDLISLYRVLYQIRMDQERRAYMWVNATNKEQRNAAMLAQKASKDPENIGLQMAALKAKQLWNAKALLTGKAMADAGIGEVHKDMAMNALKIPGMEAVSGITAGITSRLDTVIEVLKAIEACGCGGSGKRERVEATTKHAPGEPVQALAPEAKQFPKAVIPKVQKEANFNPEEKSGLDDLYKAAVDLPSERNNGNVTLAKSLIQGMEVTAAGGNSTNNSAANMETALGRLRTKMEAVRKEIDAQNEDKVTGKEGIYSSETVKELEATLQEYAQLLANFESVLEVIQKAEQSAVKEAPKEAPKSTTVPSKKAPKPSTPFVGPRRYKLAPESDWAVDESSLTEDEKAAKKARVDSAKRAMGRTPFESDRSKEIKKRLGLGQFKGVPVPPRPGLPEETPAIPVPPEPSPAMEIPPAPEVSTKEELLRRAQKQVREEEAIKASQLPVPPLPEDVPSMSVPPAPEDTFVAVPKVIVKQAGEVKPVEEKLPVKQAGEVKPVEKDAFEVLQHARVAAKEAGEKFADAMERIALGEKDQRPEALARKAAFEEKVTQELKQLQLVDKAKLIEQADESIGSLASRFRGKDAPNTNVPLLPEELSKAWKKEFGTSSSNMKKDIESKVQEARGRLNTELTPEAAEAFRKAVQWQQLLQKSVEQLFKERDAELRKFEQPSQDMSILLEWKEGIVQFTSAVQALALELPNIAARAGDVNYQNFSSNLGKEVTTPPSVNRRDRNVTSTNVLTDNRVVNIDVKSDIDIDRLQQVLQRELTRTGFSAVNV